MKASTHFVAACCRWPHSDASKAHVASTAMNISDWSDVQKVVTRHRVGPLVHLAIKHTTAVPQEFRDWVSDYAKHTAFHSMGLAKECIDIDTLLRSAGINPLHFKGPALGQIAYGSVALKFNVDLDILVNPDDVPLTVKLLQEAGYFPRDHHTALRDNQLSPIVRNFKDLGFISPTGSSIEIHWRLTHYPALLPELKNNLPRQSVTLLGKASVDTMTNAQMLEYLAIHGALHHWARLKWLADFAAILALLSPEERDDFLSKVQDGPSQVALTQALQLCDTLLGTSYVPSLSPRAITIYEFALKRIDGPYLQPKSVLGDIQFFSDLAARRSLFGTTWRALWSFKGHLYAQNDAMTLPLPPYLNAVYPIIRIPSFVMRRLRSAISTRPSKKRASTMR